MIALIRFLAFDLLCDCRVNF